MNYIEYVDKLVEKGTNNIKKPKEVLNNDKPIFNKDDYNVKEGEPIYLEPDKYGRSNGAIAIISKNTIPPILKKKITYPAPYGWNENFKGKYLFEKCHIIAYSLSARFADKRNIFIGTNDLNTSTMHKTENRIKNYINANNVRVLYKVTVKYKGNNQIPTGVLIEAKSLEDAFSVCEFCYNIEKNVKFSYKDGTIIEDKRILPKVKHKIEKIKAKFIKKENKDRNKNYIIDKKAKIFHLADSKCNELDKTEHKYIIETTATYNDLCDIKIGLKPCSKCVRNN